MASVAAAQSPTCSHSGAAWLSLSSARKANGVARCASARQQGISRERAAGSPSKRNAAELTSSIKVRRRIKRSMTGEICSHATLEITDQDGECEESIVLRIFICHSLPCLSGTWRRCRASSTSSRSTRRRGYRRRCRAAWWRDSKELVGQNGQISSFDGVSEPGGISPRLCVLHVWRLLR
jgi:hypothetical protein